MQCGGIGDLRTFRITWYWKDDPDQIVQEMYYQAPTLRDARKESKILLKRLHPDRIPVRMRSERK